MAQTESTCKIIAQEHYFKICVKIAFNINISVLGQWAIPKPLNMHISTAKFKQKQGLCIHCTGKKISTVSVKNSNDGVGVSARFSNYVLPQVLILVWWKGFSDQNDKGRYLLKKPSFDIKVKSSVLVNSPEGVDIACRNG